MGTTEQKEDAAYLIGRYWREVDNLALQQGYYIQFPTFKTPAWVIAKATELLVVRLAALSRTNPLLAQTISDKTAEICGQITDIPEKFSAEQRGLFALGYWHQKGSN